MLALVLPFFSLDICHGFQCLLGECLLCIIFAWNGYSVGSFFNGNVQNVQSCKTLVSDLFKVFFILGKPNPWIENSGTCINYLGDFFLLKINRYKVKLMLHVMSSNVGLGYYYMLLLSYSSMQEQSLKCVDENWGGSLRFRVSEIAIFLFQNQCHYTASFI